MKIRIIIPYFGKLPNFFSLFLRSCEENSEIEFLIFTDQKKVFRTPKNVTIQIISFDNLKEMIREKLNLNEQNLKVLSPYKLCDYKPAYGVIFEKYLIGVDFWGFCDIDLILGKIFDLLSFDEMKKSERILTLGHLTFYKNCERMNKMFENQLKGGINFRTVISIKEPCFFDEVFMPEICKRHNVIQYGENCFADILPQHDSFKISKLCAYENKENQIFYWEEGKLYREYIENRRKIKDELMYIHLQKRVMPFGKDIVASERIYITPKGFVSEKEYSSECEKGSIDHKIQYQRNRWSRLTIRKIWIKMKVNKFKEK